MGVNGLYGLSGSGLDIESMVKAGMLSKQNQYDKMYKKEVKNEWLKQGFNEIYTSLNTFKYSTLSDYKMSSKMSAMKASSGDSHGFGKPEMPPNCRRVPKRSRRPVRSL